MAVDKNKPTITVLCDFGDCERASTVWVTCRFSYNGESFWPSTGRPFCEGHKDKHGHHPNDAVRFEMEKDGFAVCHRERRYRPIDHSGVG